MLLRYKCSDPEVVRLCRILPQVSVDSNTIRSDNIGSTVVNPLTLYLRDELDVIPVSLLAVVVQIVINLKVKPNLKNTGLHSNRCFRFELISK